jgi:hypothetical protein
MQGIHINSLIVYSTNWYIFIFTDLFKWLFIYFLIYFLYNNLLQLFLLCGYSVSVLFIMHYPYFIFY